MNTALPRALLSILLVTGGYFAIGMSLKHSIGSFTIGNYDVVASIWMSTILSALVLAWVGFRRREFASVGLSRPKSFWKSTLIAVIATAVIYVGIGWPLTMLVSAGVIPPPKPVEGTFLVEGPSLAISVMMSLAVMWLNAAFGEELLFRGFLQNNVQNALGGSTFAGLFAVVLVSIVFGLMHVPSQGMYGLVFTATVGMALGILFLMTQRVLFTVVMAHGFINTISLVGMAAQQAG